MMFNKVMLVADAATDIRDPKAVAQLIRNMDVGNDVMFSRGVLDVLDHAAQTMGEGGKMVLDLTAGRADREIRVGGSVKLPPWAQSADISLAGEYGAVVFRCSPEAEIDLAEAVSMQNWQGINYVVALDETTGGLSYGDLLWFALANIDPVRDVTVKGGVMLVDARTKYPHRKGYPVRVPNVVTSSPETIALVNSRWNEYGIGDFVESPSGKYLPLVKGNKAQIE